MKPDCHESESTTQKQTHNNNNTVLKSTITTGTSSAVDSKSQQDLSGKRNSSTVSSRPDNSDTNNNTDSVPIIVTTTTVTNTNNNKKQKIMTAVSEAETTSCTSTQNPDTDEIMENKNNDDTTALDPSIYHQISIELTTQEQKLCDTLEAVAVAYENGTLHLPPKDNNDGTNNENSDEENKDKKRSIEIRIAGGWVRDKILKQPSHDVDIALDSMSGVEFATLLQTYLRRQQEQEQEQEQQSNNNNDSKKKKNQKLPKIAVINANPSQSKHLETATMTIHTLDCDFVHLRGEEIYTSTSRIPTTSLATPLEDALRRDFTINSLFYNVRTKFIEDWTQRGLNDLIGEDAKLVTPMDASITFHDDPLRVLRAIRFGVRYDLPLCTHITNAARSVEVHESLHVKVSRERVGKELEGMLTGKGCKPDIALNLIADLKLAGCIFAFPSSMGGGVGGGGGKKKERVKGMLEGLEYNDDDDDEEKNSHAREKGWLESTAMLNSSSHLLKPFENSNKDNVDIDIRMFYLTTFLYPFRNLTVTDAKNKTYSLATYIIRDSIKYKNKDVQNVTTILQNVEKMKDILQRVYLSSGVEGSGQGGEAFSRLEVGLLLRNVKELWPTTLLLAATAELRSRESDSSSENSQTILQATIKFYQDIVQNYNLDKCWKTRPLLDGKVMLEALDLPRGPEVGVYLEEQIHWMLLNPNGSKEECEVHLKDVRKRKLEEVAKGE